MSRARQRGSALRRERGLHGQVDAEAVANDLGLTVVPWPLQVLEEMRRRGTVLGGEQSGHIIFSDLLPTGDGLLTTLSVLKVMIETRRGLSDLTTGLEAYPQVLLNVRVRAKPELETEPDITEAIRHAEATLGRDGRVLVRYSGTEPLLRVMIEGRDGAMVDELAGAIAQCARDRLGSLV